MSWLHGDVKKYVIIWRSVDREFTIFFSEKIAQELSKFLWPLPMTACIPVLWHMKDGITEKRYCRKQNTNTKPNTMRETWRNLCHPHLPAWSANFKIQFHWDGSTYNVIVSQWVKTDIKRQNLDFFLGFQTARVLLPGLDLVWEWSQQSTSTNVEKYSEHRLYRAPNNA